MQLDDNEYSVEAVGKVVLSRVEQTVPLLAGEHASRGLCNSSKPKKVMPSLWM